LVWDISKKNQLVKNIYGSKKDKKVVLPVRVEVSYDDRYVLEVAGDNASMVRMRNLGSN
jgi:mRNA-degrading endonuclease HigB of HigAB toxin-antitoxin module